MIEVMTYIENIQDCKVLEGEREKSKMMSFLA